MVDGGSWTDGERRCPDSQDHYPPTTIHQPERTMTTTSLQIRSYVARDYADVFTPAVVSAITALAPFDADRKAIMAARMERRAKRARNRDRIAFLDPDAVIPRTRITVADARAGRFQGSDIPPALQRQWIQGTGPAAKPHSTIDKSIRNAAYALLSGADGWMFDGEDALGQVQTMSLDNQRSLKLSLSRSDVFMSVAEQVAVE